MFYLASLVPSHSNPEKYNYGTVQTDTDGHKSAEELLANIVSEGNHVYELGVDELPGITEDIRECLACHPGRVFMTLLFDQPDYFCIVELP